MKNILAENLLRFGVKNLSETDIATVNALLMEDAITSTNAVDKKPVELTNSSANFNSKDPSYGINLTYDQKGKFTGDRKLFQNYLENITISFYAGDIKKYIFPSPSADITKIQAVITEVTILDPGKSKEINAAAEYTAPHGAAGPGSGQLKQTNWIQSVVPAKLPMALSFKGAGSFAQANLQLNCRIQAGIPTDEQLSNIPKRGKSFTIELRGGQVSIKGVFRYPGSTKKEYETRINSSTNLTPEQKTAKIAEWDKKHPTGVAPSTDIPWSTTVTPSGPALKFAKAATTTPD